MSKRYKGGRRQILQLEDKKAPRSENEPTSSVPVQKAAVPLDSQVADFFKEIDALAVSEEDTVQKNIESNFEKKTKVVIPGICDDDDDDDDDEIPKLEDVIKPEEKPEGNVQKSLPKGISCPWQEICDESSGYSYYWNMETNDVTWECPVEYAEYLNSAGSSNIKNSSSAGGKKSFKIAKKKKKNDEPTVGAIIPITYFGGSSSEESSDESCKEEPSSTYKKSALKSQLPSGKLKQETTTLSSSSELFGPQLPPNFQFPNLKTASKSSEDLLQNEVDEFLEIGPKLSSTYSKSSCTVGAENSDSTVSASTSISLSRMNGTSFASSSHDALFKSSSRDHGKSYNDSYKVGEESPDSTVKKAENVVNPCVTEESKAVFSYGCKPVVEYDSFTDDDDDDQDTPTISSSKDSTFDDSKKTLQKNDVPHSNDKLFRTNNMPSNSGKDSLNLKRNYSSIFTAYSNSKKTKLHDKLDIESLFSMNTSRRKFGFGFNREQQLDLENNSFRSTKEHGSASSAVINFVKSNDVFNLNTVNEEPSSFEIKKSESPNTEFISNSQIDKDSKVSIATDFAIDPNAVKEKEVSAGESSNALENNLILDSTFSNLHNSKQKNEIELEEKLSLSNKTVMTDSNITSSEENSSTENSTLLKSSISSKMAATLSKFEKEIDEIGKALGMKSEPNVEGNAFRTSQMSMVKDVVKSAKVATEKKENDSLLRIDGAPSKLPDTSKSSSENIMDTIADLSSLLLEKLTVLTSGQTTMNFLSVLLIQIQTRLMDWQLGVLESKHFLDRLQEANQYLQQYETSCVSGDWICEWDSCSAKDCLDSALLEDTVPALVAFARYPRCFLTAFLKLFNRANKRYFYTNRRKQSTQWTYPTELMSQKASPLPCNLSSESAASSSTAICSKKNDPPVSSSVAENQLQNCSSTTLTDKAVKDGKWVLESSPPPRPPGVDSPSPPPPPFGPPDSPPPPPPDSTEEKFSVPQDMELENSNDSNPSFITIQHADLSQVQVLYGKSEHSSNQSIDANVHVSASNAVSSTSVSFSTEGCEVVRSSQIPTTFGNNLDVAKAPLGQFQPSCSNNFSTNINNRTESSKELPTENKDSEIVACSSTSSVPSTITKTVTKSEKKKSKLSAGLALKKKNIPSLVQKWEMIKKEQENEENYPCKD